MATRPSDLELFLVADCDHSLDAAADCAHPPAYTCHSAREELARLRCDLDALRREAVQGLGEMRGLSNAALNNEWLFQDGAPSRLAGRILEERGLVAPPQPSRRSRREQQ